MAPPKADKTKEVSEAITRAQPESSVKVSPRVSDEVEQARRTEALTLRLAGLTMDQIADRLGIGATSVYEMINRSLNQAENQNVEQMRSLENERLDRAQVAIWQQVLNGDLSAVQTFLRISQQRSKMNGLDAPKKVDVNVGIRNEMQRALDELESVAAEATVIDQVEEAAEEEEDDDGTAE